MVKYPQSLEEANMSLSWYKRHKAVKLLQRGFSPRQITKRLNVYRSDIQPIETAYYAGEYNNKFLPQDPVSWIISIVGLLDVGCIVYGVKPGILFRVLGWE